ncbi:unnamed protein product [Tilletia controversa]|uniref:HTH APSES-type domain-containing protein n=3 Tax=Tilletia TaxID=13289 RepID=A0A8X7MWM6_9BASI|nr:hypothetical protein CF336_g2661 [Tilletia laevis]KAE8205560.1 hypothetical protein CF328_g422 [Tilletia controversa]KAE8263423.1 hypothetical protein A4X03_0g1697 [Tilletia caries]KAE8206376.1 hypothetical protein CF335_g1932 [Tilletia laevis]KAE8252267.1 hypothetical protein A4X06_0g2308 [Tilletia controversa]
MAPTARRSTPRRGRSSSVLSNDADQNSTTANNASTGASTPAAPRASKSASSTDQKARKDRPDLPKGTNSALPDTHIPVKLQIIEREGKDIIIGRVKLPLPNSPPVSGTADHAFLLKRFDTNALAASAMFKIAFPYAGSAEERIEMDYLEARFDCDAANGGIVPSSADDATESTSDTPSKRARGRGRKSVAAPGPAPAGTGVRLQGTWIPATDALEVAEEYRILKYARNLIEARAELDDDRQLVLILPNGERIHQASSKRASSKPNGSGAGSNSAANESGSAGTDTPRRKRARQSESNATASSATSSLVNETTPSVVRTKTTRTVAQDGTEEVRVERTETSVGTFISPDEANAQLEEARAFAISKRAAAAAVAGEAGPSSSGSRKRRAVTDAPRDGSGAVGEDEEYATDGSMVPSNALVSTVRRGAQAVQRRPIISAASLVGATAAAGAGALAYASGGDLQAAIQLAQQGLATLGLSNLSGIFQF